MAATRGTRTTARPAVGGCHATVGVRQHRMAASRDLAGMASLGWLSGSPSQIHTAKVYLAELRLS